MKALFTAIFLISSLFLQAQEVSNYRYVIVPDSFATFEDDKFHLGAVFKQIVSKKNYEAVPENPAYWPSDIHNNECSALIVDFEKVSNWRKNILNVHFKTCNGKVLESFYGESTIKDYKEGYQDALRTALKNLKVSNPNQVQVTKVIPEPKDEVKVVETVEVKPSTPAPSLSLGTEFKNGNTVVQLTELKDGSLALIEKSSNKVIALLKPTSKSGVYQATVTDGNTQYTTIGYYDGETIGIDYLNSSKEFELKEFKKVQ